MWSKPPGLVCHICGREYGTTSLQIHVPQCAKKWKDQQKLLPRSERRPLPKAPMSITDMQAMKVDTGDVDAMERFNKQQMAAYTEQGLVQCQHCGRKFLQEKYHSTHTHRSPAHPHIARIARADSFLSLSLSLCVGCQSISAAALQRDLQLLWALID